ncbi:hypothetical protein [Synechococcus sp. PCC 7336]|uniref:hypothetical protein n=1 Tax=Synechococcus sp. PCC 7336 TaxID=195250 RepID=UPI00034A78F3|nr:hypothetical protein [Synechococcus sp. PCC 7336]
MPVQSVSIAGAISEVAIADLGGFQVVVPTSTIASEPRTTFQQVSVRKRIYDSQGWIVSDGRIAATLHSLKVGAIAPAGLPFAPIERIAPAVPLHFEVKTIRPLSAAIARWACFQFQYHGQMHCFNTVFRNMKAQFVKVYPFEDVLTVAETVQQLLKDEYQFVSDRRESLARVPFYRERFGL